MTEQTPTPPPAPAGRDHGPSPGDPGLHAEPSYRLLFQASPLPLWIYDLQTLRFLDVNEVACRKYGYTRDEFLSMTIRDIRPAEDIRLVEASVQTTPPEAFSSGVWRHRLKNGTLIHVEITSHELEYMGRRTRFVCPIDVTQQLRAERALREREAGLRRAQGMTRLAHVVTRPDGAFESWSETLAELAGVTAAELPRSTREWLQRVVHPLDRELFRAKSIQAAVLGARVDVEYRIRQPDGQIVHVYQVIEPIEEADSAAPSRWFSTLQDITERMQAQAHMARLNEDLEGRVRERTQQLEASNRDLAEAIVAAERANRAKSDFLSNMSHELRTPLNAIVGFGQLLAAPDPALRAPERQALYVQHIVNAGQHLLTLINEILDLAQIEAGRLSTNIERLALRDMLSECQAMIEPLAMQRNIRVHLPVDSAAVVRADRTRLKQVLLNLLSNAIKYNRPGGDVAVEVVPAPDGQVRIAVRDTGAGLEPQQLAALFQPFNRLGREGGPESGTGIGLVLTKRLVEAMQGTIGVDSAPGQGSAFWIELHAGDDSGASPPYVAQKAPLSAPPSAAATPSPMATVLYVEDDLASIELVRAALGVRSDVELLSASNGRLGVELARAHLPSVILMDNNMPELSGLEAQAILQRDPRTSHIPIIALSASAPATGATGAAPAGFFRRLVKPFDVRELLGALDEALRATRRSDAPSAVDDGSRP